MDKYEERRLLLSDILASKCSGKIVDLAEKLGKDSTYVARMLYPEGKAGRKRIGEDMLDHIKDVFGDIDPSKDADPAINEINELLRSTDEIGRGKALYAIKEIVEMRNALRSSSLVQAKQLQPVPPGTMAKIRQSNAEMIERISETSTAKSPLLPDHQKPHKGAKNQ